jgi:crossover junction endodeoxyribonuclease RuvC
MNYIGIDLSIAGTAVTVLDSTVKDNPDKFIVNELISTGPKDFPCFEERMDHVATRVFNICNEYKDSKIYMEGLSFGSRGQSMLELAALHYYVRLLFNKSKIPFKVVPPTVVKKFVTSKGNAPKELMLMYCLDKFKVKFTNNNLCDSYCLARLAFYEDK